MPAIILAIAALDFVVGLVMVAVLDALRSF